MFDVVTGHLYLWAWYLGMYQAMRAEDATLVASLWQMALTTSVHLRHGLSESKLAIWSIQSAEQSRFQDGVLGDTFPAFAMKCLPIIGELDVSNSKAQIKMAEAGVVFRGAKANKTMAAAVLQFRSSVGSEATRILAEIESAHGRDVLSMHYNKISRLVQICTEASKHVDIPGPQLVVCVLEALHFALHHEQVKPCDVNMLFLDNGRDGKKATYHGFVVRAIARRAFVQNLCLEMRDLEAQVGTAETLVQDLKRLCADVANYEAFERAFSPPEGTEPQAHLEKYKQEHLSTSSSKDAVDILFDVLSGDHDLALSMKSLTEGWERTIHWCCVGIEGWTELAGKLSLR